MNLDISLITDYHIHIYYDDENSGQTAKKLRNELNIRFDVELGMWRDKPGGPHPIPMYQVNFAVPLFPKIVPWLMLNRSGLTILVHPQTGNDLADHKDHALWLGRILGLNFDVL